MRVYTQLCPDEISRDRLQTVQRSLPKQKSGRQIDYDELHMTVIHFGKADEIYEMLKKYIAIDRKKYDEHLDSYIQSTEKAIKGFSDRLEHTGYSMFGKNKTTLVATFSSTYELEKIHLKCLRLLEKFFKKIGIQDVKTFMRNDLNFVNAETTNPHVTLYKGYEGDVPTKKLGMALFEAMQVRY